ncbi:MAG TPA: hypothetical protein VOA87_08785 [Thermoanaerobaculia bacterium]|nr:hypothetical protein [Thermoanaerobaculia bacterium]
MNKRILLLTVAAAVVGGTTLLFILWSNSWNNPSKKELGWVAFGPYHGNLVQVSMSCNCPSALIESRKQPIVLAISLSRPQQGSGHQIAQPGLPSLPSKSFYAWVDSINATTELAPSELPSAEMGSDEQLASGINANLYLSITPSGAGPVSMILHLASALRGQPLDPDIAKLEWDPVVHPTFLKATTPFIYSGLAFACALGVLFAIDRRYRQLRLRTEQRLAEAKKRAENNPEETQAAWDIARIKLEAYFDRNLIQVNLVFWVAVFVITVGFGFVLAGVLFSLNNPKELSTPRLAAVSGIITQFIGATVMVIYRSTMLQANEFMSILERINTVGMAVRELDRIPESQSDLKSKVRAHVVELLLSVGRPGSTQQRKGR